MWTRRILSQEKDNHILPWSIPFLLPYNPSDQYFWNSFVLQTPILISYFSSEKQTEIVQVFQKCWLQLLSIWNEFGECFATRRHFFCLLIYLTLCLRIFYSLGLFAKWSFRLNPSCRPFVSFFTSRFFKFYCFTIWNTQTPLNAYFCSHAALGVSVGLKYCNQAYIKVYTSNFFFI